MCGMKKLFSPLLVIAAAALSGHTLGEFNLPQGPGQPIKGDNGDKKEVVVMLLSQQILEREWKRIISRNC